MFPFHPYLICARFQSVCVSEWWRLSKQNSYITVASIILSFVDFAYANFCLWYHSDSHAHLCLLGLGDNTSPCGHHLEPRMLVVGDFQLSSLSGWAMASVLPLHHLSRTNDRAALIVWCVFSVTPQIDLFWLINMKFTWKGYLSLTFQWNTVLYLKLDSFFFFWHCFWVNLYTICLNLSSRCYAEILWQKQLGVKGFFLTHHSRVHCGDEAKAAGAGSSWSQLAFSIFYSQEACSWDSPTRSQDGSSHSK